MSLRVRIPCYEMTSNNYAVSIHKPNIWSIAGLFPDERGTVENIVHCNACRLYPVTRTINISIMQTERIELDRFACAVRYNIFR